MEQNIALTHVGVERNMVNRERSDSSSTESDSQDTSEDSSTGMSDDPIIRGSKSSKSLYSNCCNLFLYVGLSALLSGIKMPKS